MKIKLKCSQPRSSIYRIRTIASDIIMKTKLLIVLNKGEPGKYKSDSLKILLESSKSNFKECKSNLDLTLMELEIKMLHLVWLSWNQWSLKGTKAIFLRNRTENLGLCMKNMKFRSMSRKSRCSRKWNITKTKSNTWKNLYKTRKKIYMRRNSCSKTNITNARGTLDKISEKREKECNNWYQKLTKPSKKYIRNILRTRTNWRVPCSSSNKLGMISIPSNQS